jgi:hypothetical protein
MFRTYKNQELKKIFEPKRYELKWGWRKRLWGALTCCSRPKRIPQFVTTVTSGNTGMMMVTFAMESPTDNNFLTHTYKSYKKRSTWLWAPSVAMHNPIYIPPFATFWLQTWSFTQPPPPPHKVQRRKNRRTWGPSQWSSSSSQSTWEIQVQPVTGSVSK